MVLNAYPDAARKALWLKVSGDGNCYFLFYNTERQHQSLDYQTPQEVYEERLTNGQGGALCAA